MTEKPKAVVLLSGGMDSCVTAAIANQTHRLAALHVSYAQRTERRERRAFEEVADFYGVRERLGNPPGFFRTDRRLGADRSADHGTRIRRRAGTRCRDSHHVRPLPQRAFSVCSGELGGSNRRDRDFYRRGGGR